MHGRLVDQILMHGRKGRVPTPRQLSTTSYQSLTNFLISPSQNGLRILSFTPWGASIWLANYSSIIRSLNALSMHIIKSVQQDY